MVKLSGWTRKEGKDSDGYRWFTWVSNLNDDISITVDRSSIQIERVGPQQVNAIYHPKSSPHYKKYLGYFTRYNKKGDAQFLLGGSIRTWNNKKKRYDSKSGKGPWTQEEAMNFAYNHIDNNEFNERYVTPKEYDLNIPGWEFEKRGPFWNMWINKNDGRHQIAVHGLLHDYTVEHTFGYGGENPKTILKKKIGSFPAAMSYATDYIKTYPPIRQGQLEKNLETFRTKVIPKITSMPEGELSAMSKLMEEGHLKPEEAIKRVMSTPTKPRPDLKRLPK